MTSHPKKYENHKELGRMRRFCTCFIQGDTSCAYLMCTYSHDRHRERNRLATQATLRRKALPPHQKWMIMSLAAMTAQSLLGAIPALALPLKARASSER
jgi:hypothetical protein